MIATYIAGKIAEMENERKGADKILSTYDYRPLLIDALENAQNSVCRKQDTVRNRRIQLRR